MNDLEQAIAAAKEAGYNEAVPAEDDILPNGTYQFVLDDIELTTFPDKEGVPQLTAVSTFIVAAGEHEGRVVKDYDRLGRAQSLPYWKSKLRKLGISPETPLEELEPHFSRVKRSLCTCKVKNNPRDGGGFFTNLQLMSVDGKDESVPI